MDCSNGEQKSHFGQREVPGLVFSAVSIQLGAFQFRDLGAVESAVLLVTPRSPGSAQSINCRSPGTVLLLRAPCNLLAM